MPGADRPGAEQRPRIREGGHKKEPIREHLFGGCSMCSCREGGGGLACTSASGWLQKYLKSNLRRTAAVVDRDLKWKTKY